MKLKNLRSRTLEIAATGQLVEPGAEVEVDDDLGKQLAEQSDTWGLVKTSPAKSPSKNTGDAGKEE